MVDHGVDRPAARVLLAARLLHAAADGGEGGAGGQDAPGGRAEGSLEGVHGGDVLGFFFLSGFFLSSLISFVANGFYIRCLW